MAANINSVNFAGSPGTLVVDPVAGKGQFTTITAAVAAATTGQTVFIRPGTYTENFTITTNIALVGMTAGGHTAHEIVINGKITVSSNIFPTIEGLTLTTNSDFCLTNTSTGRPTIRNCLLNAANNAILENTSTGGIYVYNSQLYLLTNTAFFSNTSTGFIRFFNCSNPTGTQLTASNSTGIIDIFNSTFNMAMSTSSGGTINVYNSYLLCAVAVPNIAYTGTGTSVITNSNLTNTGSQEVATIGSGARLNITSCTISSSAANALSGAGRIDYGGLIFVNTATTNVTTEVYKPLTVKQGGTGVSSNTAYAVLCGGTTSTGAIQSISGVGSAGQVLTSNGAGALPTFQGATSGVLVKQVRATSTSATTSNVIIPYDDTIPQNTEGAEILTVSITPANTNNILVIQWNGFLGTNSSQMGTVALFQDTTANALNATSSYLGTVSLGQDVSLVHTMTAGTTSSTTFKIRIGPNSAGTIILNGTNGARLFGGVATSVLTVTEYTP